MAVHGFFVLLLVAKSMAIWDSNSGISNWNSPGHARATPTQCTQRGSFCSNCQESYLCSSDTATPFVNACASDEICGGNAGFAACTAFLGTSAGDCDCDTVGNLGFLADPYDTSKYFICIQPERQILLTCEDGFVFSAEDNGCVEENDSGIKQTDSNVDCTANPVGFYTNDPTCETYTVCYSDRLPGIFQSCSTTGEAFDTSVTGCVDRCLLGPTTFECQPGVSGALGDSGAFPDTSDCTIFHVCSNGALISPSSGVPCPDGQLFNPTTMLCGPASTDLVCPVINSCWAAYCDACTGTCPTGTSSPIINTESPTLISDSSATSSSGPTITTPAGPSGIPNCDNNPGYFEYSTDCKQFWSCQNDDAGGYEAILYRCPGVLVFIPTLSYCSLQSDLPAAPGCITSK